MKDKKLTLEKDYERWRIRLNNDLNIAFDVCENSFNDILKALNHIHKILNNDICGQFDDFLGMGGETFIDNTSGDFFEFRYERYEGAIVNYYYTLSKNDVIRLNNQLLKTIKEETKEIIKEFTI